MFQTLPKVRPPLPPINTLPVMNRIGYVVRTTTKVPPFLLAPAVEAFHVGVTVTSLATSPIAWLRTTCVISAFVAVVRAGSAHGRA